jgi:CelD/BcsL family acetyltransferase involved in cellulose biosynthesis
LRVHLDQTPFDGLADDWDELFRGDRSATPFMAYEWARAWWRHYGAGAKAVVVTVRDGDALVGLAPLVIRRRGPIRQLSPLGKEPADYWDVLARDAVRAAVTELVVRELVRIDGEWDVLHLTGLPEASGTTAVVDRLLPRREPRPPFRCPGIELPESWDGFLASLPSKRRTDLRRRLRRLDEGELELRTPSGPDAIRGAIARWHEMRERQWAALDKELDPSHRAPVFRDFLAEMAVALVPVGLARVTEVYHAAEPAGVFVTMEDANTVYWYLGAFEPRLRSLAIGKMATAAAIRASIESGRRYFDFTVGDEAYKYDFGAVDRLMPYIVGGTDRLRSRAALVAIRARRRLRG